MADLAASTSGFPVDFTGCGTASMVLNELVLTIFNPVGSTLATGAELIAVVSRQRIGRGLRNCRGRTRTGTRLSSPPPLAGPGGSGHGRGAAGTTPSKRPGGHLPSETAWDQFLGGLRRSEAA